MTPWKTLIFLLLGTRAAFSQTAPVWLQDASPQIVFAGGERPVQAIIRNPGEQVSEIIVRVRLWQASSATVIPVRAAQDWKTLRIPPGQTVIESATLTFPEIRAASRFLVQWIDPQGGILASTDVLALPPDLLKRLKTLAGETLLGLLDTESQLKPLLVKTEVPFEELRDADQIQNFKGRLAIIISAEPDDQKQLAQKFRARAGAGLAIVWFKPVSALSAATLTFPFAVGGQARALVIAPVHEISLLPDSPRKQLQLLRMAELALNPTPNLDP